jgi:hypothetical protein
MLILRKVAILHSVLTAVRDEDLLDVHRKKQFNTAVQALTFSTDGNVMFSSAGAKEVSTSALRIKGNDILSVEFGGFSSDTKLDNRTIDRDDDLGGDLRIMGIDVRDQKMGDVGGYLVALVLSDSTVKVTTPSMSHIDRSCIGSIQKQETTIF